jgi:glutamate racemase
MENKWPIGVFDSGYGGLTVLQSIVKQLPQYDYIYLGDNARTPYGTRSFEVVNQFTLEGVKKLFQMGCRLVVLACNTASAKALRNIQQKYLPLHEPERRVLGVLRPTTEVIGNLSKTKKIGILGTTGTVQSNSYVIEINQFFPEVKVFQQACPLWVPLIENNEHQGNGAGYFVNKYLEALLVQDREIDTLLLACTHYPLLMEKIRKALTSPIEIIAQGDIVAKSLASYLKRHPEMEQLCSGNGMVKFLTTDSSEMFDRQAAIFYEGNVRSERIEIGE